MSELDAGTVVDGSYEILAAIGSGGLGTVYRARDVDDDSTVALKMLNITGDEAQQRFVREFNILSRIRHPRIVRSHKWGLNAGKPYFSMDYIHGRPLSDLIASAEDLERLRTGWLLRLVRQIGEGLAYIHEQGVVHRDLKPSNIMILDVKGKPEIRVLDLGLARFRESGAQRMTAPVIPAGTVEYMSPEQIRGRLEDQRSDLYSLGVILYEILAGKPPFTGVDPASVMLQHLKDLPRPPPPYNGGTTSRIGKSVMKLLEKEPIDRYSSVGCLLHDLSYRVEEVADQEERDFPVSIPPASVLQPRFQGRDREMKVLREILSETDHGKGRMVLVSGKAGIGKSQVLREFQADARVQGMRVLTGRCYEFGGPALGPILQMLERLAEQPGVRGSSLDASVGQVLTQIERPTPADQPDPYATMETLSELLGDLSRETPTLVCIEDLQWADDLTLRFLDFMRKDPDPAPLVFGLACRKEGEDSLPARIEAVLRGKDLPGVVCLQLDPLSFEETTNLAASMLGERTLPVHAETRIYEETGGNPLFVIELIRAAIENGVVWMDSGGGWRWTESAILGMPSGIMQSIESRVKRLSSDQRQALECASIFRGAFSFDLIAAVEQCDEIQLFRNLDRLVKIGILSASEYGNGRYQFSHGLIQRVVYAGVPEMKRMVLHLDAAKALEARFETDAAEIIHDLAYHFSRSNDLEKTVRYVMAAGCRALRMHDFSYAIEQFEVVLEKRAFSTDAAVCISRGTLTHVNFLCAYAEALCGCGRFEEARHELKRAMRWVSDETPAQKAYALRMFGISYSHSGDYQKAKTALSEARELYRDFGDSENELTTLGLLSNVCLRLQAKDDAVRYCHSAAAKCRELGGGIYEARAFAFLAFAAEIANRIDQAKSLLDASLKELDREGDRSYRFVCLYLLGRIEFQLGNFELSTAIFMELQAYWRRTGASSSEAEAHLYLGKIAFEEGKYQNAETHARAAERLLSDDGFLDKLVMVRALLAETLAESGRADEALASAERSWPGLEASADLRAIAWTAKAKAFAVKGRHGDVESVFEEAIKAQNPPTGPDQVYLFLTAGEYYWKRRRVGDARMYLQTAKASGEEIGMHYYAEKAERHLKNICQEVEGWSARDRMAFALPGKHFVTLYEVSKDLTSILDLNVLLDRILDRLMKVSKTECAMIALKDKSAFGIQVARARNMDDATAREISHSIIQRVMKINEPVLCQNAQADERFRKRKSVSDYGIRSVLCVPLHHVESGVIGALYMDHRKIENLFTKDDKDFLLAFANLVSVAVINARMYSQVKERAHFFQMQIEDRWRLEDLVGQSQTMQETFNLLGHAAKSDVTVLIQGETGTGKELAARAIHARSERRAKPFLSANCAAMTHELLQSELFGHKKGAFTGASSDRKGLFVSAAEGTVFLDEIGNASPQLQSSLLRVLQNGEIQRVGEANVQNVDVRVIAATNRDLEADVRNGQFREDLYYRLRVLQIEMPPLRLHIEDIPILSEHILKSVSTDQNKTVAGFTVGAIRALMEHRWPGNVRELENEISRATALVEDGKEITAELFSERIGLAHKPAHAQSYFKSRVAALERRMIVDALDVCAGNITRAADRLGLSRNGLQKMMARHGLRKVT